MPQKIPMTAMRVLALACFALIVSAAGAGGQPISNALKTSCQDDYQKYCAATVLGGGRVLKCMQSHERELTPACRAALAEQHPAAQQQSGPKSSNSITPSRASQRRMHR